MSGDPIREPQAIAKLLARLLNEREPLSVWRVPGTTAYSSLLVGLKDAQGVYLDAPPESLIQEYKKGDKLLVRARLDDRDLHFRTQLLLHSRYEQYPALLCDWPEEIHHQERRRAFRVRVSSGDTTVELVNNGQERWPARLLDLSVGGFAALISDTARLLPGELLDCKLEVCGETLETRVAVHCFQAVEGTAFYRVGAGFDQLETSQERLLGRLVLELQRLAIQTRPAQRGRTAREE